MSHCIWKVPDKQRADDVIDDHDLTCFALIDEKHLPA